MQGSYFPTTPQPSSTKTEDPLDESEVAAKRVTADAVLAIPVLLMKCVFLWPDSQNAVTRFIVKWIFPVNVSLLVVCGVGFIVEGKYGGGVKVLTTTGDALAATVCLFKLLLLAREGPQVRAERWCIFYER